MSALERAAHGFMARLRLQAKPAAEPEPINAVKRPMTGFFGSLTDAQKTEALRYRENENHGEAEMKKAGT